MPYTNDNQVVSALMFNSHGFRERDKMVNLFKTTFWNSVFRMELFYYVFFFKLYFNVFLNFPIQITVLFYHAALRSVVGVQTPCTGWRHYMETVFLILFQCEGNPPVTSEFPAQRTSDTEVYLPVYFQKCCFCLIDWWANSMHRITGMKNTSIWQLKVVSGSNVSYHNDNLLCHQWQQIVKLTTFCFQWWDDFSDNFWIIRIVFLLPWTQDSGLRTQDSGRIYSTWIYTV